MVHPFPVLLHFHLDRLRPRVPEAQDRVGDIVHGLHPVVVLDGVQVVEVELIEHRIAEHRPIKIIIQMDIAKHNYKTYIESLNSLLKNSFKIIGVREKVW